MTSLPSPASAPMAEPTERKRFEAWADDQGFLLGRTVHGDDYQDLRTQGTWDAWQARAALSTSTGQAEPINLDKLAKCLQEKIKERDLSERSAAREIGIGAATLGRMLDGSAAPHTPDLASVQKATAWIASGQAEPSVDAKDAARWRAFRANTGNEIDLSSGPGSAKAMVIRINVEGCEKWLESGTPDIPATLDAAMDDEVRIQADAARAALSKGDSK